MLEKVLQVSWFILLTALLCEPGSVMADDKHASVVRIGCTGRFDPDWGMVVERVEPGSVAQLIGIKRGDVIVEINGAALRSLGHYYRLLATTRGRLQFTIEDCLSRKLVTRNLQIHVRNGELEATIPVSSENTEAIARGNR